MEIKELRQKSEIELQKLLKATREQVRDLRFKIAGKQHKDVRDLRYAKKTVAKIFTVLKERKILAKIRSEKNNELGIEKYETSK